MTDWRRFRFCVSKGDMEFLYALVEKGRFANPSEAVRRGIELLGEEEVLGRRMDPQRTLDTEAQGGSHDA